MFYGLSNVFRQPVPIFACIASPLNDKIQKDQPFHFELNEKKLESMKRLAQKLMSFPVLALPCAERQIVVDSVARDVQFWFLLLQDHPAKQLNQRSTRLARIQALNVCTARQNEIVSL